ncbi:Peptidyl-prolyl cis-trans isomerase A precursor [Pseudobythopirellula maris]|uniref:Peptidyl-prolyl cis-trans isomerase n=1 Tax=Pseudobythopirellula maris TaxID=2527991 RepID=A0A5C5ZNZ0_9BACT|nr:peptidylprolyl isomerase [Pseudobythopirellula maris]TWT88898.1 Peptidyl-prolyl cis-trans isomerase A precursor [Pseudobythopirellula maris]
MFHAFPLRSSLVALALTACLGASARANTTVRFETTMGDFEIGLFDTETPITVDNFLNYVEDGDWVDSIFHRSAEDFVVQGGGFYDDLTSVPTDASIQNEFSAARSNLRGTVAMAKLGSSPDSATSQWFVNLGDNSANLDFQNGGFTVFGVILGDGMDLFDSINELPRIDATSEGSAFGELPVLNALDGTDPDNLVVVTNVSVVTGPTIVESVSPPPPASGGSTPTVPEPATGLLALTAAAFAAARHRRG